MINSKVFFLGKKNCKYSKLFLSILKKNFTNVNFHFCKNKNDKLNHSVIKKWHGDYIFSFRSYIILKKIFLKKAKVASINFHPGPPNFRGIGCVNFAILKKNNFYGSTVHLMNEKIDNGKILDVKIFKINKRMSIERILNKTYENQIKQFNFIIKKIKNKSFTQFLSKKKNSKFEWSKNLYQRKDLNRLYEIPKNVKKKKLDLLLRATVTKNYKPHVLICGKKFFYGEK